MNTLRAAMIATAAFAALPASAQDIQLANIKCKDFLGSSKEEIGNILAWLEGFYTKPTTKPVFSTTRLVNDAKKLAEYCKKNGEEGLIKASDAVYKRQ